MDKGKLNCQAPQCSYWRENCGCSCDRNADNGQLVCDKGEERYEYQIFVVVEGGNVIGVYSDKPEINVELCDLDNARADTENENALDDTQKRFDEIAEKYHHIYGL